MYVVFFKGVSEECMVMPIQESKGEFYDNDSIRGFKDSSDLPKKAIFNTYGPYVQYMIRLLVADGSVLL